MDLVKDLITIAPVIYILISAFLVLLVGLFIKNENGQNILQYISYAGIGLAFYSIIASYDITSVTVFFNALQVDNLYRFISIIVLGALLLVILTSYDYVNKANIKAGEYYALLLFATAGMMLLVSANDLITMFLSIEIMSLSIYILVGITRQVERSNEASMKYFIMGAFASAFLLYGMALIYGATGTIYINKFSESIRSNTLAIIGLGIFIVGFAFKIGAVPFHYWVPDAYEGAPTPVTAFMAVAVKAAGFAALIRTVMIGFYGQGEVWGHILWATAVLTVIIGNVIALAQKSVKRMLAYSSIAHTGYALIGVVAASSVTNVSNSIASSLFYLFVYSFMTLGAFIFIIYATRNGKEAEAFEDYIGLAYRKPWSAAAMAIFMISLAGIPPTAGFFAKFYIFKSAIEGKFYVLTIIGILTTIISLYYYLKVLVMMFMTKPTEETVEKPYIGVTVAILITAIVTLFLGIMPSAYLDIAIRAIPFW